MLHLKKVFFPLTLVLIFCATLAVSHDAMAQQKTAIVSLQRALNNVEEGKRAKASIQAKMDAKKKELDAQKTELKTLRDDIEKQKAVLSKEALDKKASELQTKFMALQQQAMQAEQELKTEEATSVQKILDALKLSVVELAKQKGYDMVFENSADTVLYAPNVPDITADLISYYNTRKK